MKVKNIKIAVRSMEDVFHEIKDVFEKADRGEKIRPSEGIYFESMDALRKVLTEERLRVLKIVKREHPSSIYELAKMLKRDVKNTYNDVQFLARTGLLELKKTASSNRTKTMPEVNYDKILLEIAV